MELEVVSLVCTYLIEIIYIYGVMALVNLNWFETKFFPKMFASIYLLLLLRGKQLENNLTYQMHKDFDVF